MVGGRADGRSRQGGLGEHYLSSETVQKHGNTTCFDEQIHTTRALYVHVRVSWECVWAAR